MERLVKYLSFFSIAHLFFSVLIFFGIGIFVDTPDYTSSFNVFYVIGLAVIATLTQSLLFTGISYYIEVEGITFFLLSSIIELALCNVLYYLFINVPSSSELPATLMMNICLVAALVISMIIQQYNSESYS